MVSFNLLKLLASLTVLASTTSAIGIFCYPDGAISNKVEINKHLTRVCLGAGGARGLNGNFKTGERKNLCLSTEYGQYAEEHTGSYYFDIHNMLGRDAFMEEDGCMEMFEIIRDRCDRGGNLVIQGPDFHWTFNLDPNMAHCGK